ncbi:MAG: YfiR family protein [Acidobacteriota bacterium]|nr:YfiR family protein [Acidobacteriota bacterium]
MNRTLITACFLVLSAGPLLSQGGDEQRLKAAFVFRFPQFVTWPPASTTGRNTVEICVTAAPATADALRDLTSGESLNGRPFVVRENPSVQSLGSCHVLMVTARPDRAVMARAAALPILTVGDSETFLDDGGIIQLRLVDRRVRFEISLPAAARAGITLSSQLLRLAAGVRGGQ